MISHTNMVFLIALLLLYCRSITLSLNEAGVAVTKDLKTIYYTANNFYEKKFLTDSSGVNNLQMFRASLDTEGKWTEKEKLPFNQVEYSIGHPALNHEDTKLYFVSDMPGCCGLILLYVNKFMSL